jgi:hypothetical protein
VRGTRRSGQSKKSDDIEIESFLREESTEQTRTPNKPDNMDTACEQNMLQPSAQDPFSNNLSFGKKDGQVEVAT